MSRGGVFSFVIGLLLAPHLAQAESVHGIAPPSYLAPYLSRLDSELRLRGADAIPAPECTGFPNGDPLRPDMAVYCKVTGACWSASLSGHEGRVDVFLFVAPSRDSCLKTTLAAAEAAYVQAFVACDSEEGRARAIDRLLNQPQDASDAAKIAAFEAEAKVDPGYVKRFNIQDLCGAMLGYRYIAPFRNGVREEIWLAALGPLRSHPTSPQQGGNP